MSSYARPIVFVGKEFEEEFEALDFLKERKFFDNDEYDYIVDKINSGESNLEEFISDKFKKFPNSEFLDYVNGTGYFIGYTVAYYKTEDDMLGFLSDIEVAKTQWKELFKEEGVVCIRVQTS